jgi:high-affinity nickel-transport protein
VDVSLVTSAGEGAGIGLVITAFTFGLRHGIDWDHIAAITDITSSQDQPRRSISLATLYALGHALVVFVLGIAAIWAGDLLPANIDSMMEPVVGVTLVVLGIYVFYSLIRHGRDFRMRSRWMLVFAGARKLVRWIRRKFRGGNEIVEFEHDHDHPTDGPHHEPARAYALAGAPAAVATASTIHRHPHRHVVPMPEDPFMNYGRLTAFGVGMIHGVGAETPTQVLLFLAAAGAGGRVAGVIVLVAFLVGLVATNSLIALASTFGFLRAGRNFPVYATVAVLTGTMSLVVGTLFLFGEGAVLPAFFSG